MKTRPSALVVISSPRVPPVARAICCSVARSTMVSSLALAGGVGLVVGDEQQSGERAAWSAKGDGIDVGHELDHDLRGGRDRVEPYHVVGVLGPGRRPQRAVRSEGQAAHADVAVLAEGIGGGVEDVDAVAGRHIDQPRARLDGQGLGDAVAELPKDGARRGVQLQQRSAAGRGPDVPRGIHGQIVNRIRQRRQGRAGLAAGAGEQEELVAVRAAAGQHRTVRQDQDRHGADVRFALADAGGEGLAGERLQHRLELWTAWPAVGAGEGTPCWACVNSTFVDGWVLGCAGVPKSVEVLGTVGSVPRLTEALLLGTDRPAGGCSWLPALSVASARN